MLAEFHWMRPVWLLALPLAFALWWWLSRRGMKLDSPWHHWVDAELHAVVISGGGSSPTSRRGWFALIAAVLGILALAGPSWERVSMPVQRGNDALVVALDLSRSMDATDIAPSRLARARLKLLDILAERRDGETALVVFSANAFVVTPLTNDGDTIASQVLALDSSLMPTRGSFPESGIRKALQLLDQSEVRSGDVLLITDGANLGPAMTAARELAQAGHRLSVMGVGTAEGGPIPEPRGGFVTDTRGTIALPKLDERGLERLATAGRGRYVTMTNNNRDIRQLRLTDDARQATTHERDASELELERWRDAGPVVLLMLVPLVAWLLRRGVLLAPLLVLLVLPTQHAHAFNPLEWFANDDQRALDALKEGDAERAARLFDDPRWQAVATYRGGDYADSAAQWAAIEGAEARYNQGTALAQAGQLDEAKAMLREALALDPEHEDAAHNLRLLESIPEPPDEPGEGGEQQGEQSDGEQSGESQAENSEQSAGNSEGESAQPTDGDAGAEQSERARNAEQEARDIAELIEALKAAQEAGDEQAEEQAQLALEQAQDEQESEQALQQWLRRVPDDPGGLLRAKFRRQYQRRRTDQDGNMLWPDDRSEPW